MKMVQLHCTTHLDLEAHLCERSPYSPYTRPLVYRLNGKVNKVKQRLTLRNQSDEHCRSNLAGRGSPLVFGSTCNALIFSLMASDTLGVVPDIHGPSSDESSDPPLDDMGPEQTNGHTPGLQGHEQDSDTAEDSGGSDVDDDTVDEHTRSGIEREAEEGEDEDEDEEDEDEDDEDEEPTLKYERMPGSINDLLKKDSISALTVSNKLVVGRFRVQLHLHHLDISIRPVVLTAESYMYSI